ncbi:MAG: hypothetical protein K2K98_01610 [Muribaculaceae bacterium]|nr:hypothetical protein [Muribaculaceae bacterium]
MSKENFKIVDFEDTTVTDFATVARGKQLDVARAAKPVSFSMLGSKATLSVTTELKLRSEKREVHNLLRFSAKTWTL